MPEDHLPEFNDRQLARYSRHLLLPEIDLEGQQRIGATRVALIGAGGLGNPAALYLGASGIGHLTIVDDDAVDLGNLQRQIAFDDTTLGQPKAPALCRRIEALNPEVSTRALTRRADETALAELAADHDLLIDASDNFETRFALGRASLTTATPLVSGAAIRFQGQVTLFDPRRPDSPCYRCLYIEESEEEQESCADRGIFSPLTGIVGAAMAAEALKLAGGFGEPLVGRLLLIDALTLSMRTVRLRRDPACPGCSAPL